MIEAEPRDVPHRRGQCPPLCASLSSSVFFDRRCFVSSANLKMDRTKPVTLAYKRIGDLDIHLDVHLPKESSINIDARPSSSTPLPAVIYFHAGGLTVGERSSWFPTWLHGM